MADAAVASMTLNLTDGFEMQTLEPCAAAPRITKEAKMGDDIEMTWNDFSGTRMGCTVCGGYTEKFELLCEGVQVSEDGQRWRIRVCGACLAENDKGRSIDGRLEGHARRLEAAAAFTRAIIGRLKVPTHAEWQEANKRANDLYEANQLEDRKKSIPRHVLIHDRPPHRR